MLTTAAGGNSAVSQREFWSPKTTANSGITWQAEPAEDDSVHNSHSEAILADSQCTTARDAIRSQLRELAGQVVESVENLGGFWSICNWIDVTILVSLMMTSIEEAPDDEILLRVLQMYLVQSGASSNTHRSLFALTNRDVFNYHPQWNTTVMMAPYRALLAINSYLSNRRRRTL